MAVPGYEALMLPFLKLLAGSKERSRAEVVASLAETFHLTEDDLAILLPSGKQALFHNRVGWATTNLAKAGLVESTRKGHYRITAKGLAVLAADPSEIDRAFLMQYETFRDFQMKKGKASSPAVVNGKTHPGTVPPVQPSPLTPLETLQVAYEEITDALAQDLLARVKDCSPAFFERLVVQLLVRMGYGGSEADAAQAVGRAGDGGIDGIIKEDPLGLDSVYVQAKRWDSSVGSPEIQKFVGALHGRKARKGVFITTSKFTSDAVHFASLVDTKVALVDGEQLAKLMIANGVGVSAVESFEIRRVDSDYFVEG